MSARGEMTIQATVRPTAAQLAAVFASWDEGTQAVFFREVVSILEDSGSPAARSIQAHAIGKALADEAWETREFLREVVGGFEP